jgi:hypothetical protein
MTPAVNRRTHRRMIASYVAPRSFAPRTRPALEGLGYHIVPAATRGRFDDASWRPDLRLVDERHLSRLPREPNDVPIICVSERGPHATGDARVAGFATRPVDVAQIYPVLQRVLEAHPRRAARAPTRISARCSLRDQRWSAELHALSETGALLRCRGDLAPGLNLNVLFPLPLGRMISTRARVVSHGAAGTAVTFPTLPPASRGAIADYVERRLASASAN